MPETGSAGASDGYRGSMARMVAAIGVAVLLASGAVVDADASAQAAVAQPASSCVARIAKYAFQPASVPEGATATLTLTVKDCADRALHVSLVQFGEEPPGLILDPVSQPATLRPAHPYHRQQSWTAPQATGTLRLTVDVNGHNGALLATSTADLTITP